jgi:hypothetical protein
MKINYFCMGILLSSIFTLNSFMSTCFSAPLSLGGAAGADFPLSHGDEAGAGIAAEGFYRLDPYEVRFHFSEMKVESYSVVLAMKHFLSNGVIRPYIEGAVGPLIMHTNHKGLAYGAKPEVSLGADIALGPHFSTGVVTRYFGLVYFGSTNSGKFEANHGLSLLANLILWF